MLFEQERRKVWSLLNLGDMEKTHRIRLSNTSVLFFTQKKEKKSCFISTSNQSFSLSKPANS